jgi:hypothetical protein
MLNFEGIILSKYVSRFGQMQHAKLYPIEGGL